MGYNLYFTRGEEPHSPEAEPIAKAEWTSFADSRSDLAYYGELTLADDETERVVMLSVSGFAEATFYWSEGEVVVTGLYEDAETKYVAQMARDLNARLLGAEGEVYEP